MAKEKKKNKKFFDRKKTEWLHMIDTTFLYEDDPKQWVYLSTIKNILSKLDGREYDDKVYDEIDAQMSHINMRDQRRKLYTYLRSLRGDFDYIFGGKSDEENTVERN